MPTLEYHLYRIKFIKPSQIDLFHHNITPQDLFIKGINEKPSIKFRQSNVWHIGNVEYFNPSEGRFAIGRTTITTLEKFDEKTGNFTEKTDDSGPYTFVYFDSKLGLLAICKKTKVAADVKSIGNKIQKLLSNSNLIKQSKIEIRVEHIRDPESFINKIQRAYSIKKFTATFTGPNPIDADELFQRPLSYYCQQLDGEQGSVVVSGESLNEDAVTAVARSTAATANDASAVILKNRGDRPEKITFKGDAKKVIISDEEDKTIVILKIKEAYNEVRQ